MMIKWLLFIFLVLFLLPVSASDTNAQAGCLIGQGATGLISAPTISGFGSTTGVCNKDLSSAFKPYKIPTYDSLKSLYYTQSKASKLPITSLPATITDQTIYLVNGNLAISSNPTGGGTAVIFVEGSLDISQNLTYGTATTGLVFVVKESVYIAPTVNTINAVIISSGFIYTAANSSSTCKHTFPVPTTDPLVINGSLISIYKDRTQEQTCTSDTPPSSCPIIEFCRTLSSGNTQASEQVNHQVKYLVILRNLLSDTLQGWSEVQAED